LRGHHGNDEQQWMEAAARYCPPVNKIGNAWRWFRQQWNVVTWVLAALTLIFAALAVTFGAIVLVQWAELRSRDMPPAWGTIFAGVGAVGTLIAFGALLVTVLEWRAGHNERRDREADPARLIVAEPVGGDDPVAADNIVIRNHSSEPVFDLDIERLDQERGDAVVFQNMGQRVVTGTGSMQPTRVPVLQGGQTTETRLTVITTAEVDHASGVELLRPTFTDARGHRWRRTGRAARRQPHRWRVEQNDGDQAASRAPARKWSAKPFCSCSPGEVLPRTSINCPCVN
jgi:hypothetical protein